jgi:hypothetical protein
MPLYPSKVLQARERAPTPYSSIVFSLGLKFESLKELGVRQSWNLDGFPNLQRAIAGVKTHWIQEFLISLERSWT